mgnify:CR=1 FL=1
MSVCQADDFGRPGTPEAPPKAPRGVQDMSDDELMSIFDEHLVETAAGMVPFREANEADQNRYLEAVVGGAV